MLLDPDCTGSSSSSSSSSSTMLAAYSCLLAMHCLSSIRGDGSLEIGSLAWRIERKISESMSEIRKDAARVKCFWFKPSTPFKQFPTKARSTLISEAFI